MLMGYRCSTAVAVILVAALHSISYGMIRGDKGNTPVTDPGWPKGTAAVFNSPHRIAWWEDPPFGGGRWHSECQGDSQKLSQVIDGLAKAESVKKRIVVHSGVTRSFWLDPNREQIGNRAIEIDWVFVVWEKAKWDFQKGLPIHISALQKEKSPEPVTELHVYTGGLVDWKQIQVPDGMEVFDHRMEAHGFSISDRRVLQGQITNFESNEPLMASISLESMDAKSDGRTYHVVENTTCDSKGNWTLMGIRPGQYRVVARLKEFVSCVIAHATVDDEPGWERFETKMKKTAALKGRVVDPENNALVKVDVRLVANEYEPIEDYKTTTNDKGEFEWNNVPVGQATVQVHRIGYYRPRNRTEVSIPSDNLVLEMSPAGAIRIEVVFLNPRPSDYIVEMEDANGSGVGKWGASGKINDENWIEFKNIPPAKYLVYGKPNPASPDQKTKPIKVEIVGGKSLEVELEAK